MNYKGIIWLGLVFGCSMIHAGEIVDVPLAAVEQYLDAKELQERQPSLYGKLVSVGGEEEAGYQFDAFATAPDVGEPWVNIFDSSATWDSRSRNCVKRLIGKDTCPTSSEELFRKSRPKIADGIAGTILSFGLKPFFGQMPWRFTFDDEAFSAAMMEAESRQDHDAFKELVQRYQDGWDEILRFEDFVADAIKQKESHISLQLIGFSESDAIDDQGFFDIEAEFPWRQKALTGTTLEELVLNVEALVEDVRTKSPAELVVLHPVCPGKRLQYLIKEASCNVVVDWYGKQVTASGELQVKSWLLPKMPMLEYTSSDDVLKVEYRNGFLAVQNVSDKAVTVRRLDFVNGGKVLRQNLATNSVSPGKHIYYDELVAKGAFTEALGKGKSVNPRKMSNMERYGVRVAYTINRQSGTAYFTEEVTIKEILKSDIVTLQEKGRALEDLSLYQQSFWDFREARKHRATQAIIDKLKAQRAKKGI